MIVGLLVGQGVGVADGLSVNVMFVCMYIYEIIFCFWKRFWYAETLNWC